MALGKKTGGGSRKGRPNKAKAALEMAVKQAQTSAKANGLMPLDYMLEVMRDQNAFQPRRDDMARAAAPYLHPRLASTEVKLPEKIVHEIRVKIVGE